MSPYQGEKDGISAGGKWMQFESEDKMTGAKRVRFELIADNYFREDPDYKPRVELFCEDGKLKIADFNPGVRLPPPNRPGFWGQIAEFSPAGLYTDQVRRACDLTPKRPSKELTVNQ